MEGMKNIRVGNEKLSVLPYTKCMQKGQLCILG